ncbi:MAG: tripartite tricarboxylate transporter permease [Oscillospiraceae bacterium]
MDISALSVALTQIFEPYNIIVLVSGVLLGIFIGAMPGLSSVMGLSIMLPFTFQLEGISSILMLLGIFSGSIYGGSISAILMNTPGTSASAATSLDGYPMAAKLRQPGRALGISTFSSLCGGVFSCIVLIFGATALSKVALHFESPEFFALAFFGISMITSVSGKSVIKGLMGGVFGLLLATVGADNFTGTYRFSFGLSFLKGGMSMVPVLIGVFAFTQALNIIETKYNEKKFQEKVKIERVFPTKADLKRIWTTIVRSSFLGTFIGAVPGTGGDIASWVGYNEAKRWSKHKEEFGKGSPEGIAGSEAANNAIAGGAFVPLLSLGIPGDAGTAVMLGALTMLGVTAGPLLFVDHTDKAYEIFIGLLLANLLMGLFGFLLIRVFGKVINIPAKYLNPIVLTFCIVGTFALNHYTQEVYLMLIMGILGYVLTKFDFPMPPIILGLVLGALAEKNMRRGMDLFASGESIWEHPIAIIFVVISLISLFAPIIIKLIKDKKKVKSGPAGQDSNPEV